MKRVICLIAVVCTLALCCMTGYGETIGIYKDPMDFYPFNKPITTGVDGKYAVNCTNGTFIGKSSTGTVVYKGIPYATQPVGNLRFKPPVPAREDSGVYEAYYFGHISLQNANTLQGTAYYPQGEDCLNLNLWVNEKKVKGKKPVIVFFTGNSANPLYDGAAFIKENSDIILVTVNYRVGFMGFANFSLFPGISKYPESCNLGLLDCLEALRWIKGNIENFGGNPENVTITGDNAMFLPFAAGAEGLFQKVISMSGSPALTYSKEESLEQVGETVAGAGYKRIEELSTLTSGKLASIIHSISDREYYPVRDGSILPEDIYEAAKSGKCVSCDWIIGTNADEENILIGKLGNKFEKLCCCLAETYLKTASPEDRTTAKKYFSLGGEKEYMFRCSGFLTELIYRIPSISLADSLVGNDRNVYIYCWKFPSKLENYGACHGIQLAAFFNNPNATALTGGSYDSILAKTFRTAVAEFAKSGDVKSANSKWRPYDSIYRATMMFDSTSSVLYDPFTTERALINPLLKYNFNGDLGGVSYFVPYIYKIGGYIAGGFSAAIIIALLIIFRIRKVRKANAANESENDN